MEIVSSFSVEGSGKGGIKEQPLAVTAVTKAWRTVLSPMVRNKGSAVSFETLCAVFVGFKKGTGDGSGHERIEAFSNDGVEEAAGCWTNAFVGCFYCGGSQGVDEAFLNSSGNNDANVRLGKMTAVLSQQVRDGNFRSSGVRG